ncbi:MAG TPA: NAD-dependent epimerase/dehydratase family protein [Saprospiraceae bacterium]|nr:NAD-dependent epimerase/dehydratase family protein [Saprospiraceae bacterium]
MNKILITGGAGNIGGSLASRLVKDPANYIVIVDNLLTGSMAKLPSKNHDNWRFIKSNVNDYNQISAVMLAHHFDYVFHFAAVVGVKRTLENPLLVLEDLEGIKNILTLSKNTGVKRVFYSSSSEVYGEPVEIPQYEDTTPLNSRLPYAIVKNVGEAFFKTYHQEFGLEYNIFRFFNTYGPQQSTDFVISRFLQQALHQDNITIYGNGLQTRTFCYIDDNLETMEKILIGELHKNSVLNIGSDHEITILDLAKLIIAETGSKSEIIFLPALKEGDMTRRKPDISKMKSILQRDLLSLPEGIRKTCNESNLLS